MTKNNTVWLLIATIVIQTIVLLFVFKFFTAYGSSMPLSFSGDGLFATIIGKSVNESGIFSSFFTSQLNYPFGTSLDAFYPIPEKIIYWAYGFFINLFGVGWATKILLVSNHLLTAVTCTWVLRRLKASPLFCVLGGVCIASSPFVFSRGFGHIVIGTIFHLPLILLILVKWRSVFSTMFYRGWRRVKITLLFILTFGLSPYYSFLLIFSSTFIIIARFHKFKDQVLRLLSTLVLGVVSFILYNIGYFNDILDKGISLRNITAVEVYGLKIPELFLPTYHPTLSLISKASNILYYNEAYVKGEVWGPFLGFPGIFMAGVVAWFVIARDYFNSDRVSRFCSLAILFVLVFSLVGGLNLLLATFGFNLLRATNRYSIVILLLIFFIGARIFSASRPQTVPKRLLYRATVIVCAVFVYLDLPRTIDRSWYEATNAEYTRYQSYAAKLEAIGGGVIFLPAMRFPENGPVRDVPDYEPLKLVSVSNNIKVDYGAMRGMDLTLSAAGLSPTIKAKHYGYRAVFIDKRGYGEPNGYRSDLGALAGAAEFVFEDDRVLILSLDPSGVDRITGPGEEVIFDYGWSSPESWGIWAMSRRPSVVIRDFSCLNGASCTDIYEFVAAIQSFGPEREVEILVDNVSWKTIRVGNKPSPLKIPLGKLSGPIKIRFKTSGKLMSPGGGDSRRLSISLHNPKLVKTLGGDGNQ